MHLSAINIYPIKACRGIPLQRWDVEPRGFRFDRRWMIVDEHGVFISQRTHHALARVDVGIDDGSLTIGSTHHGSVRVPLDATSAQRLRVSIWSSSVEAEPSPPEASEWFSRYLGKRCTLVRMPDDGRRSVDPAYALPGDEVSFADGYPYLLISEASLDHLNGRLSNAIPMNRFRPNLVVAGTEAHAEDTWTRLTIGAISFSAPKQCARCVVPTVDQETGEAGTEPSVTLAAYRMRNNNIYFGQNLIARNSGTLSVGDAVTLPEN